MSDKKILFVSYQHFANLAYDLLKDDIKNFHVIQYEVWNRLNLVSKYFLAKKYNIIHSFWAKNSYNDTIACRLAGCKYINHYIGSDVLRVTGGSQSALKKALTVYRNSWKTFADCENLIDELKSVSIKNVGLLQIYYFDESDRNYSIVTPQNKSVLTYIPEGKEDFYGLDFVKEAALKFPEIEFRVTSNRGKYDNMPENIKFLGWVNDMNKEIDNCFIYLRKTKHDGLPTSVMQALCRARHVLCVSKIPFTREANFTELRNCLETNEMNMAGRNYILENYSKKSVIDKFINAYNA